MIDRADWSILSKLLYEWLDLEPESRPRWLKNLSPEYSHVLPALQKLIAEESAISSRTFLNT